MCAPLCSLCSSVGQPPFIFRKGQAEYIIPNLLEETCHVSSRLSSPQICELLCGTRGLSRLRAAGDTISSVGSPLT
ncbi:hypothetical protein XENOCAPTIV_011778 [Xenoophorus captivus]|uniref:Uncharacterized protein n=1 Tax=Xenoophorus captivus TaxID=1517983 RepID=A0ABV0R0W5_9TELE